MAILSHLALGGICMTLTGFSLLFMLFVVLGGVTGAPPLNNTYFLEAVTAGITGARPVSRWNFFYICGANNYFCGPAVPAIPFGYAWASYPSFAPGDFIGDMAGNTTSKYFYYMWRFGWVFYLMSFLFNIIAFFTGFLACFGRLGAAVSGIITMITLFFYTLAVSLMSATFCNARNIFRNNNRDAHIGSGAFGFSWTAWVFLIFASGLYFVSMRGEHDLRPRRGQRRPRSNKSGSLKGSPKGSTEKRRAREEYA